MNDFMDDFYGNGQQVKAPTKKAKKSYTGFDFTKLKYIFIAVSVVVFGGMFVFMHQSGVERRAEEAAIRAEQKAFNEMKFDMQVMTDNIARQSANYPETVKYSDHDRWSSNDNFYIVVRSYTAENAFGVPMEFTVNARFDKENHNLVDFDVY